ncbi:MAG: hypothetical protein EBZ59_11705, partial [Planctomycetia bacterium]|nr:hypothetical protein [Planctomycetia bacterium]
TRAIARAFDHPVSLWTDDERPVGIHYDRSPLDRWSASAPLVGVVVELREGDQVRRRTRVWWRAGRERTGGWTVEYEDAPALRRLRAQATEIVAAAEAVVRSAPVEEEPVPGWTLLIRGDALTALRALPGGADPGEQVRAWVGEIEWPLTVSRPPTNAPRRSNWNQRNDPIGGLRDESHSNPTLP